MARAIQCDVCGKFFRDDIPLSESGIIKITFVESFPNTESGSIKHPIDICDDCHAAIYRLMEQRGYGRIREE